MLQKKLFIFFAFIPSLLFAQPDLDSIDEQQFIADFMKQTELEMVNEINLVRANPREYLQFVMPYVEQARKNYQEGKDEKSYTLITNYYKVEGEGKVQRVDTVWFNPYEEELKAVSTLVKKLKMMPSLNLLEPHEGIYNASKKHGDDMGSNNWVLTHRGSDGSWPNDRIKKFATEMQFGNENLACKGPSATAREIVIQLLIDSGIKGSRHRLNILNPQWTHVACYYGGFHNNQHNWIQSFGKVNPEQAKTGLP
ncbi:MAG: hypothetical protein CMO01_12500 [Thalassobius sp.]|nr:hypothetical protein [Thalassovita sp.]